ncbi:MAG: dockerin type I repeat-containing protein [Prevotella sp.]|nr:dockerin type I repeat-containing protein [Prevotella sp.]
MTLLAAGSATITARGEETANCLSAEASYEVTVKLRGDVNGDNTVDVADIASIISVMAGTNAALKAAADINGDKVVDVADISSVISIMAARARRQAGL